jgi:hypothetical protein
MATGQIFFGAARIRELAQRAKQNAAAVSANAREPRACGATGI